MLFAYNTNKCSYSEANTVLKKLHRAIDDQQHIQIIYLGSDGHTTQRTVRPLAVSGDRLKAYCLTRRAPRAFVIDNILAVYPASVTKKGA
ncbi:WYL domain-containing protein [Brevibacillus reuszeri]|uniref:WYL domain-containing protein n=1 Tax=Brevibacillus reuszeri TaxID=54915 RepID=UPI00366B485A